MTIRCKCRKCGTRRSLSKPPEEYVRKLRCWNCGHSAQLAEDVYRVDKYRQTGRERKHSPRCRCDGWWFPHRYKSRGCNYYESYDHG